MSKNVLDKILVFSMVLTGVIALIGSASAYDAQDGGYSYSVRNINGSPEDIGVGEEVKLTTIETNYKNGVQSRVYETASGVQYTVNVRDDGSYNILKNGVSVKDGKGGQVLTTGMTPEYLAMVQKSFYGADVDMSGYTPPSASQENGYDPLDTNEGEEFGEGEEDGDATDVDANTYNVTQTTTTNKNGVEETVTETSTYKVDGPSETSPEAESKENDDTTNDNKETTSSGQKTGAETKKEDEDLSQYTGLYNGRYILPDIMARHCRIKGEDVAKDVSLYVDCIKKYVADMNNENATAKAEAEKEFEILRYKTLIDAASNAMVKTQSILNYEETMNKYNSADQEAQTEFDDNHALIATMSFMIDVINSFRELQAEQLKYLAINGIVDIDPAIVMAEEEEEKENNKSGTSSSSEGSDFSSTKSEYKLEQQ